MSPVWVKLGDFGVSKRVQAQATTTFHTQVSTPVYTAPEVLGLDSNSETSYYTNSVDIWSLGCVIYELLVGTKLFLSEGQVSRYYFDQYPFPEATLQGLSPPTDDLGISLLKSMLIIQPGDRPTAEGALNHEWLAGLKRNTEESGENEDGMTQSRDDKGRSGRTSIRGDGTSCTWRGVGLVADAGSQMDSDPPGSILGTATMTPSHAAHTASSVLVFQMGARTEEFVRCDFEAPHSEGSVGFKYGLWALSLVVLLFFLNCAMDMVGG